MSRALVGAVDVRPEVRVDAHGCLYVPTSHVADLVRKLMTELPEDQRLRILIDYCRGCGTDDPICQCENDE